MATFEDFKKIDIRVGKIIEVEDFPETRNPSYKLKVDFGELGVKVSSAQLTKLYSKADLLHRQIISGEVILLQPEREAPLGYKIG